MTTTASRPPRTTRKQHVVLASLREGKDAAAIAKVMGISKNGVYGHIRKLKAAGLIDKDGVPIARTKRAKSPVRSRSTNGHRKDATGVLAILADAQKQAADRVRELDATIEAAAKEKEAILMRLDHPETPKA